MVYCKRLPPLNSTTTYVIIVRFVAEVEQNIGFSLGLQFRHSHKESETDPEKDKFVLLSNHG